MGAVCTEASPRDVEETTVTSKPPGVCTLFASFPIVAVLGALEIGSADEVFGGDGKEMRELRSQTKKMVKLPPRVALVSWLLNYIIYLEYKDHSSRKDYTFISSVVIVNRIEAE
jgi:hypothetical protein